MRKNNRNKIKTLKVITLLFIIASFWIPFANVQLNKVEAATYYMWDKHAITTATKYRLKLISETTSSSLMGGSGYSSSGLNEDTGLFATNRGEYDDSYHCSGGSAWRPSNSTTAINYSGTGNCYGDKVTIGTYTSEPYLAQIKGGFIQTVTATVSNAYPLNGKHSDGYWYTNRRLVTNDIPNLTLLTPTTQALSEVNGYNKLIISGTAKDTDKGDVLTLRYKIDGLPLHQNKELKE